MSQRPPISFRFTDHELEVLEREQSQTESLNQTAARLLRERLGIINVDSEYTLSQHTLERWIDNAVVAKVKHIVYENNETVYELINKLNKRVDELEQKLETRSKSTRKTTAKSTQNVTQIDNDNIK